MSIEYPIIRKTEATEDGKSYQLEFSNGMKLWFDLWRDDLGDLTGDWNQYIFFLTDPIDVRKKEFQMNPENFSLALDACVYDYEK